MATISHQPVLLTEVLGWMAPRPGAHLLDATFGGGGHSRALLAAAPGVSLLALDRDPVAAERAAALAAEEPERFRFRAANFADLPELEVGPFDGVLLDLGVSSFHFDDGQRGFSFRHSGPVDMRMDPAHGRSAAEFLEHAEERELVRAVRDYGEEPRWRLVVRALISARGSGRLAETTALAKVIADALGPAALAHRTHPATRTFQGLRMAVNGELEALAAVLPAAFDLLKLGGRLAVISFHSLEDRMVKRYYRRLAGMPEHRRDPVHQGDRPAYARILTNRAASASAEEVQANPRARSARLRVLEKLSHAPAGAVLPPPVLAS